MSFELRQRLLLIAIAAMIAVLVPLAPPVADAQDTDGQGSGLPTQLAVTEIYANPSGSHTWSKSWIEISNPSTEPVSMAGWQFRLSGATARPFATDVTIPAGGAATACRLASSADSCTLGTWGPWQLPTESAAIELVSPEGLVVDVVNYDSSWPNALGQTMQLDPRATNTVANDLSANWCTFADSTPAALNVNCPGFEPPAGDPVGGELDGGGGEPTTGEPIENPRDGLFPTAIVSLGDSFVSGTGAGDYQAVPIGGSLAEFSGHRPWEPGDDWVNAGPRNAYWCMRSANATVMVAGSLLEDIEQSFNVACDGARPPDVYDPERTTRWDRVAGEPVALPRQVDQLLALAATNDVRVVMLGIGANEDTGTFGSAVKDCVLNYFIAKNLELLEAAGHATTKPCAPTMDSTFHNKVNEIEKAANAVIAGLSSLTLPDGSPMYPPGSYRFMLQGYTNPVAETPPPTLDGFALLDDERLWDYRYRIGCAIHDESLDNAHHFSGQLDYAVQEAWERLAEDNADLDIVYLNVEDAFDGARLCETSGTGDNITVIDPEAAYANPFWTVHITDDTRPDGFERLPVVRSYLDTDVDVVSVLGAALNAISNLLERVLLFWLAWVPAPPLPDVGGGSSDLQEKYDLDQQLRRDLNQWGLRFDVVLDCGITQICNESMHPNAAGHEALGKCLAQAVETAGFQETFYCGSQVTNEPPQAVQPELVLSALLDPVVDQTGTLVGINVPFETQIRQAVTVLSDVSVLAYSDNGGLVPTAIDGRTGTFTIQNLDPSRPAEVTLVATGTSGDVVVSDSWTQTLDFANAPVQLVANTWPTEVSIVSTQMLDSPERFYLGANLEYPGEFTASVSSSSPQVASAVFSQSKRLFLVVDCSTPKTETVTLDVHLAAGSFSETYTVEQILGVSSTTCPGAVAPPLIPTFTGAWWSDESNQLWVSGTWTGPFGTAAIETVTGAAPAFVAANPPGTFLVTYDCPVANVNWFMLKVGDKVRVLNPVTAAASFGLEDPCPSVTTLTANVTSVSSSAGGVTINGTWQDSSGVPTLVGIEGPEPVTSANLDGTFEAVFPCPAASTAVFELVSHDLSQRLAISIAAEATLLGINDPCQPQPEPTISVAITSADFDSQRRQVLLTGSFDFSADAEVTLATAGGAEVVSGDSTGLVIGVACADVATAEVDFTATTLAGGTASETLNALAVIGQFDDPCEPSASFSLRTARFLDGSDLLRVWINYQTTGDVTVEIEDNEHASNPRTFAAYARTNIRCQIRDNATIDLVATNWDGTEIERATFVIADIIEAQNITTQCRPALTNVAMDTGFFDATMGSVSAPLSWEVVPVTAPVSWTLTDGQTELASSSDPTVTVPCDALDPKLMVEADHPTHPKTIELNLAELMSLCADPAVTISIDSATFSRSTRLVTFAGSFDTNIASPTFSLEGSGGADVVSDQPAALIVEAACSDSSTATVTVTASGSAGEEAAATFAAADYADDPCAPSASFSVLSAGMVAGVERVRIGIGFVVTGDVQVSIKDTDATSYTISGPTWIRTDIACPIEPDTAFEVFAWNWDGADVERTTFTVAQIMEDEGVQACPDDTPVAPSIVDIAAVIAQGWDSASNSIAVQLTVGTDPAGRPVTWSSGATSGDVATPIVISCDVPVGDVTLTAGTGQLTTSQTLTLADLVDGACPDAVIPPVLTQQPGPATFDAASDSIVDAIGWAVTPADATVTWTLIDGSGSVIASGDAGTVVTIPCSAPDAMLVVEAFHDGVADQIGPIEAAALLANCPQPEPPIAPTVDTTNVSLSYHSESQSIAVSIEFAVGPDGTQTSADSIGVSGMIEDQTRFVGAASCPLLPDASVTISAANTVGEATATVVLSDHMSSPLCPPAFEAELLSAKLAGTGMRVSVNSTGSNNPDVFTSYTSDSLELFQSNSALEGSFYIVCDADAAGSFTVVGTHTGYTETSSITFSMGDVLAVFDYSDGPPCILDPNEIQMSWSRMNEITWLPQGNEPAGGMTMRVSAPGATRIATTGSTTGHTSPTSVFGDQGDFWVRSTCADGTITFTAEGPSGTYGELTVDIAAYLRRNDPGGQCDVQGLDLSVGAATVVFEDYANGRGAKVSWPVSAPGADQIELTSMSGTYLAVPDPVLGDQGVLTVEALCGEAGTVAFAATSTVLIKDTASASVSQVIAAADSSGFCGGPVDPGDQLVLSWSHDVSVVDTSATVQFTVSAPGATQIELLRLSGSAVPGLPTSTFNDAGTLSVEVPCRTSTWVRLRASNATESVQSESISLAQLVSGCGDSPEPTTSPTGEATGVRTIMTMPGQSVRLQLSFGVVMPDAASAELLSDQGNVTVRDGWLSLHTDSVCETVDDVELRVMLESGEQYDFTYRIVDLLGQIGVALADVDSFCEPWFTRSPNAATLTAGGVPAVLVEFDWHPPVGSSIALASATSGSPNVIAINENSVWLACHDENVENDHYSNSAVARFDIDGKLGSHTVSFVYGYSVMVAVANICPNLTIDRQHLGDSTDQLGNKVARFRLTPSLPGSTYAGDYFVSEASQEGVVVTQQGSTLEVHVSCAGVSDGSAYSRIEVRATEHNLAMWATGLFTTC